MRNTLQDVFRNGFDHYKKAHGLSLEQNEAAQAIMRCQTDELGSEEWICHDDGYTETIPHSCRHRSCPRCNGGLTHDWLEKSRARLLACDHYHVVFTLPHELNALWQYNRAWCTDRLFKAAVETLKQLLSDERYLGAEVGILAALHTWGRTLSFHPHVHLLVTGGGVARDGHWQACQRDFLLPVGVIKAKFRGKWLHWLNAAYAAGEIRLPEYWREADLKKAMSTVAKKNWNVRIQGAYRHGQGVASYLARYVRGGPIKDSRLLEAGDAAIRFRYRDHHDGKDKVMVLKTEHFIGRVLSHVPVKGHHVVRYYGIYVPGAHKARAVARRELGMEAEKRYEPTSKPRHCPNCGNVLFHHLSRRCKNSYIRCAPVQLGIKADHDGARLPWDVQIMRPPAVFFGRSVAA